MFCFFFLDSDRGNTLPDKELGKAGQAACDAHADGERHNEHDAVGEDLGIRHHQVRVRDDAFTYVRYTD
jgi:hypothetical protein